MVCSSVPLILIWTGHPSPLDCEVSKPTMLDKIHSSPSCLLSWHFIITIVTLSKNSTFPTHRYVHAGQSSYASPSCPSHTAVIAPQEPSQKQDCGCNLHWQHYLGEVIETRGDGIIAWLVETNLWGHASWNTDQDVVVVSRIGKGKLLQKLQPSSSKCSNPSWTWTAP